MANVMIYFIYSFKSTRLVYWIFLKVLNTLQIDGCIFSNDYLMINTFGYQSKCILCWALFLNLLYSPILLQVYISNSLRLWQAGVDSL